jgi:hypothetical protein
MQTNRLTDFEACEDEKKGCNSVESGGDDSLVFIIIGVAACCLVLLLGIVWYFVHKRVDRQFTLQAEMTTTAKEIVVHKMQKDMADAGDSKSIDNEITPAAPPASSRRVVGTRSSSCWSTVLGDALVAGCSFTNRLTD